MSESEARESNSGDTPASRLTQPLEVSAGDTPKGDEVDHPNHYNAGRFEAIDVIEDTLTREEFRGFCLGNVMKYVMRARHKGGLTDLRKAEWYMRRLIEREEEDG